MFCKVVKNKKRALVPKAPRQKRIFLLEPIRSVTPARLKPQKQKTAPIAQRKKTTSIAGMCETCFTKTYARAKKSVERNIARTPSIRNLSSVVKAQAFLPLPAEQPHSSEHFSVGANDRTRRATTTAAYTAAAAIIAMTITVCILSETEQFTALICYERRGISEHGHITDHKQRPSPRVRLTPRSEEHTSE